MWQIYILISVLTYSVSTILQRSILKQPESDVKAYAILFQAIVGLLIGFFGILIHSLQFPTFATFQSLAPQLFTMSCIYGIGSIFVFSALKHMDASRFSILYAVRAIVTIIIASFFLHEAFLGKYILG